MEKSVSVAKRIAVIGPESSGKSSLCKALAEALDAHLVAEFAREYLGIHGPQYDEGDLLAIAEVQFNRNQEARGSILICDTELLTIKIWAQEKLARVHPRIQALLSLQHFDHYLLCAPDIPWEADPLRENPEDRARLFELYRKELEALGWSYSIVEGNRALPAIIQRLGLPAE